MNPLPAVIALVLLAVPDAGWCQGTGTPRAFPGAEGFGAYTTGGRGGRVIEVTTLDDDGPGSLREAVEAAGPRTVVFRVAGTIALRSTLAIRRGNITIAGQTSPGGICISTYPLIVDTSNVVIRYVRSRLGDGARRAEDALSGAAGPGTPVHRNIIIDHCSISWGLDECASFYDVQDFTMQWCFITESLARSFHPKGEHGFGGIWGGRRASFHHNLLAHHTSRTPRFNGSRTSSLPDSELVDFRNNVIYNWGFNSSYGGEEGNQNIVGNTYKSGPATKASVRGRILDPLDARGNWYVAGNTVVGFPAITADNWNGGVQGEFAEVQKARRRLSPFPAGDVTTHTADEAYRLVLAHAGAGFPQRDTVDRRIAREVETGNATHGGAWGEGTGIIDSQTRVGGWPALVQTPPPADGDHDGMPDEWELRNGLNPGDAADGPLPVADGTTNLERYLNELAVTDERQDLHIAAELPWSERIARSFLLRHPGGVTFDSLQPDERWNYEQGLMLVSLHDMWRHTGRQEYMEFIRMNLDRYVADDGTIRTYRLTDYNLDNIGPGRALLAVYALTREEKYRRAADTLRLQLREQPRTADGGFWHKKIYPWQMWLDGLFMAAPFAVWYAEMFREPDLADDVVNQFLLIERHTRDSTTGLLAHGWDERREQPWADPVTGRSPSYWGRAMGWYAMALVDVLDYLPESHPQRGEIIRILRDLAAAVRRVRDAKTHLWYQVVDQGNREGNYLEASASAMFIYAYAKGSRMGYLDPGYRTRAEESFRGLVDHLVTVDGRGFVDLHQICRSAGLGGKPHRDGSFAYYISEPKRLNDMKGYGPFLRAAIELERGRNMGPDGFPHKNGGGER